MSKARSAVGGRAVDLAKPAGSVKKGNMFAALANSDSESDSDSDVSVCVPAVPAVSSLHTGSKVEETSVSKEESMEELRTRWAQSKPASDFPSLFSRGRKQTDGLQPLNLDLTKPQFKEDSAIPAVAETTVGGTHRQAPYSPKTPPWWGDMVKPTAARSPPLLAIPSSASIPDIEVNYPYAQCTPPLGPTPATTVPPTLPFTQPPSSVEGTDSGSTPTITMAMRIKETLDTVAAERAAKALVNPEERVQRIKKSLDGLSFFRRPADTLATAAAASLK